MPETSFQCVNCRSDWRRKAMFLVRISNELQIATFNRQSSDLIGQYSAIILMGELMDDQSLIGDGKTVIEMISDQVPKLIGDQYDRPSNVHGKKGPQRYLGVLHPVNFSKILSRYFC